jgi:hypothetical protein
MRDEVIEQLRRIKDECYKLTGLVAYDRLRIEYSNNKKINDRGKLDMIPIFHCYSS